MAQKSISEQINFFDPIVSSILREIKKVNFQIDQKKSLWRGVTLEDRSNLRLSSDESAWFAQSEQEGRSYAKKIPYTNFNFTYVIEVKPIITSYIPSLDLRYITDRCKPDGIIALWQKNVLLPILMNRWNTGTIIGFLDQPTNEILLAASTYTIISHSPTTNLE